jgi:uncharacterized protein YbjT (DUF2867 family)
MATVLVTGGTGRLGRELLPRLLAAGHAVRVLTRRANAALPEGAAAVVGDLTTSAGLQHAVAGTDAIVHAASTPWRNTHETDVEGTRRLTEAAKAAGTAHLCYVSIVGVDTPASSYYRGKLDAERVVTASGVGHTTLRATQFHEFVGEMCERLARTPLLPVIGGATMQPVDAGEVADAIVEQLANGPGGRVPDMGGPEVRAMTDLARAWLRARWRKAWVVPLPALGKGFALMRAGVLTCPTRKVGRITWEQHLRSGAS